MEPEQMQAKLEWYVKAYEQVRETVGDDSLATAIVEQVGKDVRTQLMNDSRSTGSVRSSEFTSRSEKRVIDVDAPVSEKQVALLRRLGATHVDPEMSKGTASQLIDELKTTTAAR